LSNLKTFDIIKNVNALLAQLVEQLPFKEMVAGSNPARRTFKAAKSGFKIKYADLAQLVEQLSCKQQVVGPSPTVGSVITFYLKNSLLYRLEFFS